MKKRRILTAILVLAMALFTVSALCFAGSAEEPSIYLSDLTPTTATAGWNSVHYDEDLNGSKLKLNNAGDSITYDKGLFAHVDSLIEYDLTDIPARKLTAYIGINDGSQGYKAQASADFEVKADGVSIYKSGVLKIDSKAEFISVTIPDGTKKLSLITTQADHTNYADHTAWCDAKLILDPSVGDLLNSIEASIPVSVLPEGESAKIDFTALSFKGEEISAGKLSMSYTSSNTSIATVSSDGTVTAKGEGSVTITVKAVKDGKTVTDEVKVNCIGKSSTKSFLLASPEGKVQILLENTADGLRYSVFTEGKTVVEPSVIGFKGNVNFVKNFTYVSKSTVKTINETYKKYSGSYSEGHDYCTEQSVKFVCGDYYFTVILRAYDDGFAYRSEIEAKNGKETSITFTDEVTNFTFPTGSTIWASELSKDDLTRGYSYESGFPAYTVDSTKGKYLAFASLVRVDDELYTLINEAELFGDLYYGSLLYGIGDRAFELHPAPMAASSVTVTLDPAFTSPWRYGVVGDLETIVENDLVENLNERAEGDYSWIRPGVTAWMWLSEGFQGQRTESTLKKYVDLAHEMGWTYLILDEGWQPGATTPGKVYEGYFDYFDDLVEYAAEKDVYFIAWVKMRDLDTVEELSLLEEWADKGIKGIKVDFIESEGVDRIEIMERIYDKCLEEKLIVNVHGFNKSTGEISRWPNIINRESLKGQEYGGVWSTDTTIWPYTRGVTGAMDITPHLYPTPSSSTTAAQQLELNIVFESGMPCMASNPETYYNSNVKFFLKNMPTSFDELEFVDGSVAGYTVLARRDGNNWYMGGVTQSAADVPVTLDFLEAGKEYLAVIYEDGEGRNDIAVRSLTVKKNDEITLHMGKQGGVTVMLLPKDEVTLPTAIETDKSVVTVKMGDTFKLSFTTIPANADLTDLQINYSDPSVATLDEDGTVTAKAPGVTTITCISPAAGVSATVEVRVYNADEDYGMACYPVKINRTVSVVAGKIIGDGKMTDLTYKIGNESIATVAKDGTVLGITPGVTTLTVTNKAGKTEIAVIAVYTDQSADSGIWEVINPTNNDKSPVLSSTARTTLKLTILTGDISNQIKNLVLTDAPAGDFEVIVEVSGGLDKDFQSVGLVAYANDENLIAVERRHHSYFSGTNVFCISTYTNTYVEKHTPESKASNNAYLKLVKEGNVFTGYYSYDGESWTKIDSITSADVAGASDLKIGLIARSGSYGAEKQITYKNFTVNGEIVPFIPEEQACQLLAPVAIEVKKGSESAGLPQTLPLYYNTGKTTDVAVAWNTEGLDLNSAGEYTVTASAQGFKAVVSVKVVDDSTPVDPPVDPPIDPPTAGDHTALFLLAAVMSMGALILLIAKKRRNA
ncbi:MAG: glycoside hydrolase family 97 catalytic domain-containing protein [Clostridia bacterium]|nr:glycoside hydrolase family 97 catalytic domain-containing protein [Clostridia bacterium]